MLESKLLEGKFLEDKVLDQKECLEMPIVAVEQSVLDDDFERSMLQISMLDERNQERVYNIGENIVMAYKWNLENYCRMHM